MNNDKYTAYSLDEIRRINGGIPLISKIKIGAKDFNINTIKDWEENHPAHQAYIYGRTHYYADEVSFSNEEINKMITDSSNEYYALCRHDFIESNTNWLPEIPWFSEDKSYDITLEQYQYKEGKFGNLIRNFDQALAELFKPDAIRDFNFEVDSLGLCLRYEENLGFNLTWSVEETAFKLLIKPKFNTSYMLLKQLDAKYIPIDNHTLNYDAATGKLCANTIFPNNLIITQDFGKYQAGEEIPAAGKSMIELFADALGDTNRPKIEAEPNTWLEIEGLRESYEVGTTANLSWQLKFMPGKYTYGTVNENDSDIYVSKVIFSLVDSSDAVVSLFVNRSEYSLTSENTIEFDFEAPESGKYKYEEQLLLNGTLGITATKSGEATIRTRIEYGRFEEDFAITKTGEISEPLVSMQLPSSVGPSIVVTNDYNWYWGSDSTPKEDKTFTNYQMGGFPETYETTQAQRWYFKVPKGQINSFELVNAKTGVAAGLLQKETTEGYDIYCITNACADKNTNLYEIHYTKNIETGGDTE